MYRESVNVETTSENSLLNLPALSSPRPNRRKSLHVDKRSELGKWRHEVGIPIEVAAVELKIKKPQDDRFCRGGDDTVWALFIDVTFRASDPGLEVLSD